MAKLGKCSLFYLKYVAEMERLYESEDPKVEELPNPDRTLKQVNVVGDTANREVAEFLEACALGIDKHFRAICTIKRIRNRKNRRNPWELGFWIGPKNATEPSVHVGVSILKKRAILAPSVWCPGGRRAEDEIVHILGRGYKSTDFPEWDSGSVGLLKVKITERLEQDIDCDLVAEVQRAFAPFTSKEIEEFDRIARIANNRAKA